MEILLEISFRAVLFVVFWYLEGLPPYIRSIKPEELWLYQNAVHPHDTVPTMWLLIMAMGIPSAFILTHYLSTNQYVDLRQGLLGLLLTAPLTGIITDLVKLSVGRPRPDFFYRCFPEGQTTSDLQCTGATDIVMEGRKSFPSGHSAWIFACFGFLALYLLGKLRCFGAGGRGEGWRLCLALCPLVAATLISLSRYQDYRHHWEDILCGGVLGFLMACICYHHHYPPPWTPEGHAPYPPSGFSKGPQYPNAKIVTSPTEVGVASEECELGTPVSGGGTVANRRY